MHGPCFDPLYLRSGELKLIDYYFFSPENNSFSLYWRKMKIFKTVTFENKIFLTEICGSIKILKKRFPNICLCFPTWIYGMYCEFAPLYCSYTMTPPVWDKMDACSSARRVHSWPTNNKLLTFLNKKGNFAGFHSRL